MLTRWDDLPRTFFALDEFLRRINRAFEETNYPQGTQQTSQWSGPNWPTLNMYDEGSKLVSAEVPGLSEQDIQLSLNQNVLSISGERNEDPPKDYAAHRQERGAVKFARSISLPCRVDHDH